MKRTRYGTAVTTDVWRAPPRIETVQILLNSADLGSGNPSDGTYNFPGPGVTDIIECKLQSFTFVNVFSNVSATGTLTISVTDSKAVETDSVAVTFAVGNWQCGVGRLATGDVVAGAYLNDVRAQIIRDSGGLVDYVELNPLNAKITIHLTGLNVAASTWTVVNSPAWLGVDSTGAVVAQTATINGQNMINLNIPQSIAISIPSFVTGATVVTAGQAQRGTTGSYFAVAPVAVNWGDQQTWEPINPPNITFSSGNSIRLNTLNVRLVNPLTGELLTDMDNGTQYQLVLTARRLIQ